MRCAAALAFVVVATFAAPARADNVWDDERRAAPNEVDSDVSAWRRPLALDVQVGFGTPLGLAGVAVEVTPIPWWTIGGGVGTSISGPQLALSSRVRYLLGHSAVAAGMALSRGPYETSDGFIHPDWTRHWSHALWLAIEGSIEHRWSTGTEVRLFVGVSGLLNPSTGQCQPADRTIVDNCNSPSGSILDFDSETVVPYLGFAFGHAFAL